MITIAAESETTIDDRVKHAFFIVEPHQEQLIRIGDLLEAGNLHPVGCCAAAHSGFCGVHGRIDRGAAAGSWLWLSQHKWYRRQGRVIVVPSNLHMPVQPDQG